MFRLLLRLIIVALCLAALCAGWMWWFAHHPLRVAAAPTEFSIKPGSSLRAASRQIVEAGVKMAPWHFEALARVLGKATDIKAGSYQISAGITPLDLLDKLTRGDVTLAEIAFIEGWTFRQMRQALDAHADLVHDTKGLREADIMRRLGAPVEQPEGQFFPDTYLFAKGSSDLDVLRRAHGAMAKHLAAGWPQRDPAVPLATPYEALILASIVEKETGRAQDRAAIAGVFANRLRAGMKLQTDPTVIYGIGESFDGNLRKRDLVADTPYNTYVRDGLPPTPIAMPGLASLQAALNPAQTDALYFVARGDGTSEFSRTLPEHNRAVTKYQKGSR